ncbi:hypothetical protein HYS84_02900 [Candidatus Saccharibacteria bacterium]|nr:hypothetical protein [Candidatus Saccharibacteria bacterium]
MHWNYRIIEHDKSKPAYFAVHEVYYDEKGNIEGWTEDPINVVGDNKTEVTMIIQHISADTKRPILKESELEKNLSKFGKNWGGL